MINPAQQATLALLSCKTLETLGQAFCECIQQWAPEAYLLNGVIPVSGQELTCYINGRDSAALKLRFDDFSHPFSQVMRTGKASIWSTLNYGVRIEHQAFRQLVQSMGKECGLFVQPLFDAEQHLYGLFAIFDSTAMLNALQQTEHPFIYLLQVYQAQIKHLKKEADMMAKNHVRNRDNDVLALSRNDATAVLPRVLVGNSSYICQLRKKIQVAITHDIPVAIEGESGSGKSEIAQLIHTYSQPTGSLVTVDCNSLDLQQQGGHLFGHTNVAESALMQANKGTLLLENIDKLASCWYGKLQHALDCGEIMPCQNLEQGSSRFRLLVTSCQPLSTIASSIPTFLPVYQRINHYPLKLQPLRYWREDLVVLSQHLLRKLCLQHQKPSFVISDELQLQLHSYHFPGNVSELKRLLELLLLESSRAGNSEGHVENNAALMELLALNFSIGSVTEPDYTQSGSLKEVVSVFEKAVINHRLLRQCFNKERVAMSLAISRRSLDMKCKKLGLAR